MKKTVQTLLVVCLLVVSAANAQYTKLLDFTGASNGDSPYGSLISDGTFLYGMTFEGGSNNLGIIFKINSNGTGYTKLLDFAGATNGSNPHGSLLSDGTILYGMTGNGGSNNLGTIFKINSDGTGYTKLLDFAGATNGKHPYGSLISDGSFLYGMTMSGGTYGFGTIFKINANGTGYTKLMDFSGTYEGNPYGSLVFDGTSLYGMTVNSGNNGFGTIFKINTNGTGYTSLLNFAGASNGGSPYGSLISDGTFLYGMTWFGGSNNLGTLFKLNPGIGYAKLLDFAGTTNGSNPNSSLISDGTFLYGMTVGGGTYGQGTIFKINPDGTGYTKLLDFTGPSNGSNPYGSLISDGTFLYGMTRYGGSANLGTVFKYCIPLTADAPDNVSACDSYVLPALTVGDYYTATNGGGTLFNEGDSISSSQTLYVYVANTCESDENSFDVTIITSTPINTTITVNGTTLTADEIGATYQWLDCDNSNAPITGETDQSFTPTANGNYAVEITKNGCSSTSSCTSITTVGISEYRVDKINIYPNPSKGLFTIVTELVGKNYGITNVLGEVLFQSTIKQIQTDIDLSNYPNGIYLLKIEGKTLKIIKN